MSTMMPGTPMPMVEVDTLSGGKMQLGGKGWKFVVVYRGAHCPKCKDYLAKLEALRAAYAADGIEILVLSADKADRARPFIETSDWTGEVGVGLSIPQMLELGLYISQPRDEQEAPAPFAEPAHYVVNDDGLVHMLDMSNVPFMRPDPEALLAGIRFHREKGFPIRGRLEA